MDSKKPIDRSTGLLLNVKKVDGVGADGERYSKDINKITLLDHSALLNPDVEPGEKNNSDGVGMFTNSEGKHEVEEVALTNSISAAKGLSVADDGTKWDASAAIERIRLFTGSKEKPSTNYRKFFAWFDQENAGDFESYKLPFADIIDGKPQVVPSALSAILSALGGDRGGVDIPESDKEQAKALVSHYKGMTKAKNSSKVKKALDLITNFIGISENQEYNAKDNVVFTNSKNGDHAMRESLIKDLKKAGMYKENMTDDQIKSAYTNMLKGDGKPKGDEKPKGEETPVKQKNSTGDLEALTAAINSAISPLKDEVEGLKTQLSAANDKEKDGYISHVVNSVSGMTKEIAGAMPLESVKALALSNGYVAFNAVASNSSSKASLDIEMPKSEEKY